MTSYPEELLLRIRAQIEGKENLTGFTTQLGEVTRQVDGLDSAISRLLNPRTPLRLALDETALKGQIQQLKSQLAGMTIRVNFAGGGTSEIRQLTTAVNDLTSHLSGLTDKQRVVIREIERVDSGTRMAATGINNLVAGYQRGAIESGKFARNAEILGKTMVNVAQDEGIFSRETAVAEAALKKLNAVNLSQLRINTQRELAAVTQAVREANTVRLDWQNGKVSDSATLERIAMMRRGYEQTQQAILSQKEALQGLGVLNEQQTKRVQVLTQQYERYGQALRNLGSIEASIQGTIQRGSLADSMSRGITASAQQATESLRLLQAQEQAGIITKRELASAFNAEVSSLRGSIVATQQQAASLRNLGVLDAQQTAELAALTRAELAYTEALARTTAAQQAAARSSSLLRTGMAAAGGNSRLNNAAMAAGFLSPELGMVGMAASMGPTVATVAALGLTAAATGKFISDAAGKAADFKAQLQQIKGISGESAEGINQYGQYIQKLSTQLPLTTEKLAEMGRQAVMVGLHSTEGMQTYTKVMANLSIVLRDVKGHTADMEKSGQEMVKFLRSIDSKDINKDLETTANTLVTLKTRYGVLIPQVIQLATYWSSSAHAAGLTQEQILGISAALVGVGARAQSAGSSLTRILDKAIVASAEGGEKAKAWADALGLTTDQFAEMIKQRPAEFIQRFADKMADAHEKGKPFAIFLGELGLKGNQLERTAAELATAHTNLGNAQRVAAEGAKDTAAAQRAAAEATDNYRDAQQRLHNAMDVFKQKAGTIFLPTLTSIIKSLTNATDLLGEFTEKLNSTKSFKEMALTFKITPADSESEAAFKFFTGALWGTGKAVSAVASASNPFKLPAQARSTELQNELISLGVLKQKATAGETYQERDYIAAHIPQFEAMLQKALATHRVELPKLGGPNLPNVAKGNQVFSGTGPLLPNQIRPDEAARRQGNLTADLFIKSMTTTVVGDSRINAWCADVVSKMLKRMGYEVESSVNARQLERNVIKAGGKVIPLSQARQGDVVFYHGIDPYTGHPYGASSGTHVEMGAGWKNNTYQLVGSNTNPHMTGKAIYDTRQATIYRLPDGNFSGSESVNGQVSSTSKLGVDPTTKLNAQLAQARHLISQVAAAALAHNDAWLSKAEQAVKDFKKSNPSVWNTNLQKQYTAATKGNVSSAGTSDLKSLQAELTHLKAQYDAGKLSLEGYHTAADKVRTQALTLQGTLKEGSKEWSAADRVIIAATTATKLHAKAAQDSALTYAQWNKNRAEATRLAKLESDLSDGKLGDKASIEARQALEKYRKNSIQAAALEEAERRLRQQQQRQEEAKHQQQDSQRAASEAAQHAQQQAQLSKQLNQQLASGQLENAQATVTQMQQALQTRLAALKNDAAGRLAVEKSLGQQVLAAQKRVLEKQRDQAVQAAHDTAATQRAELTKQYGKGKEPVALLGQISATEKSQVAAAEKTFNAANSRAYLELQERINSAQGQVNDSLDKQSQKVRDLRGAYGSLATDLRQKIDDGTVTKKDLESAGKRLAEIDKEAQAAHATSNTFLQASRTGVQAVLEAARGAAQALGDNKSAEELLKSRADAVKGVLDSTEKLFNTGDTLEAQAQSRSDALGQLAQGLSTIAGVNLSPDTLSGFQSLSDLYDHLTKSGADLENMDLTGLETLFQTYQGLSSRNADFLPLDQARAWYDELVKVGVAGKDAMELLDGSKYSAAQRSTVLEGYSALQSKDQGKLTDLQQRLLNDKSLKDSPLMRGLLDQIDGALNTLTEGIQQRVAAAQDKIASIQAQQPMTDLEARKGFLSPTDYQQQHEALATKMENDAWNRQQSDMSMDGALPTEIEAARQEHEAHLTAITRQGVQERFDLEQQSATRTLAAQRAADDALTHLAQSELERRHNLSLISEGDYIQKRYVMQVQAAKTANTRALQDATKVVVDPTTGEQHTTVDLAATRQANAALTQAQIDATNERDAAIFALTLRNKRVLEDALTAQETAALENLHSKGLLSDAEYQRQRETAEIADAQRRHDRAVEDAHGDADVIAAANVQLQTDLTTITAKGVSDREALAASERQFKVEQAKRQIDQSGGWAGHADYRAALEAERQFWQQKMAEAQKGSEAWRKAVQSQQQAADAILQDRQSQIDQYASFAHEGLSMIVDGWDAIASNQDDVDDGMRRIGFQSKDLAKAWGQDMATMVDDVANLTKSIMQGLATGNWAGAIIGGLKIVWNWFTRNSKAAAQAKEDWKTYAEQFKLIDPASFTKQTKTTTGVLFWKTDHYTIEINKMAEQVALALEKGITEGTQAGLKTAIQTGDMSNFETQIKEATYNALMDAMIAAFMESEAVKKLLGQAMTDYANNPNDPAARQRLKQAIHDFKDLSSEFVTTTREALADLAPTAGDLLAASLKTAIASGVESGAKSGILKAAQSGFSNELAQDIRTAVGNSLMDTLIDTFLKSAQMKAIIEPALNDLVSALADEDPSNDNAAFARFDKQLSVYTDKASAFATRLHTSMGNAGLLTPNGRSNQTSELDAALYTHMQSSDPTERQRALEAYRQQVGGSGGSSNYTIGSGGTLSGGTDFGGVVSALQTWSQTAAQIAQAGRDHIQAAQLQIQAANLQIQAAGAGYNRAVEQSRNTFNNGGI